MTQSDKIIYEDVAKVADQVDLKPLFGKKVLVTGAGGLIGLYIAYLLRFLNEERNANIEVDLIIRGTGPSSERLKGFRGIKGMAVLHQDVSKPIRYTKAYDYAIHGAGYASPAVFLKNPLETIDVNVIGLRSMLDSLREINPAATVLYLSSAETYGSPNMFPTPETYMGNVAVTNNRACYMESKRLSEVLGLTYQNQFKLKVRIARPALAYGPGLPMDDQRVMAQFMKKAYEQKVIEMIDDGADLRCFCYLSDMLRQLMSILLYAKDTIYNVGSAKEEITIRSLAMMIGEILNVKVIPGLGKNSAVKGAPSRVKLDLTKIESEFGFKPVVSMKSGLKRMIDWNLARRESN